MRNDCDLTLGIDIGSTTAKIVVVDRGAVLFEKYQRHFSQVRQKTLELLGRAAVLIGERPFAAALSGSAPGQYRAHLGSPPQRSHLNTRFTAGW